MTSRGRHGARRLLGAAGLVMALAALVVFIASRDERDEPGSVPRGGSRLGGAMPGAATTGGGRPSPLEERVHQLVIAGFPAERVPDRAYGGLLVRDVNVGSGAQLRRLTRRIARRARRSRRTPPLVVADPAELGRLGPADAATLGAQGSPDDARETARRAGRRLRRAGVGVVLAPSADLGVGGTPGELRAFGDDPLRVAAFVRNAVDGWRDAGLAPVPGRFPGEGAASQDPIEGPATVGLSLDELVARDLRPFAVASARAPAMQLSAAVYAAWDGVTPATLLPDAVRLLRRRLGFRGAIVSADLIAATAATGESVGRAAVDALRAGCDMLLVPGGRAEQAETLRALSEAVRRDQVPRARVEEALRRVAALGRVAGRG